MSRFVSTDAGRYQRPAIIEQPAAYADNGQGGNANAGQWTQVCAPMIHLFSAPNGRGSTRLWKYLQLYPEARHWAELRFRAEPPIDGTMTLVHRGRRYQILDAINMDEENVTILLPLVEYQAQGTRTGSAT